MEVKVDTLGGGAEVIKILPYRYPDRTNPTLAGQSFSSTFISSPKASPPTPFALQHRSRRFPSPKPTFGLDFLGGIL